MTIPSHKRLLPLLLALLVAAPTIPVVRADDASAALSLPQAADTAVPAQPAEEEAAKQKSPIQRFSQNFALIEATYDRNNGDWEELNKKYSALKNLGSREDYLVAVLTLIKDLSAFVSNVEAASQGQMDFKNRLERYSEENMLLQQELNQVSRYMNQLVAFGKTQGEQLLVAGRTIQYLKGVAAKIPPPAQFTLPNGMVFQLISAQRKGTRRTKPFYALVSPVTRGQWKAAGMELPPETPGENYDDDDPIGDITMWQALRFQAAVSHLFAGRFILPGAEHVRMICKEKPWKEMACAVWLGASWSEEYPLVEVATRFGVKWAGVWDPTGSLGGTLQLSADNPGICPEVPQAAYRQLGCLLVTEVGTGMAIRASRIQELVSSQASRKGDDAVTL